ncbi:hypothetical protein FHY31_000980 [Xanthomonas euvesicatoria]|uniref:Uncharacterized protein n=1 Tax=Xanthomonas euvesicatoria TaxID=456327 RepID=A0AAW3U0T9_XANEU|nr:hypothetical protein [Xanthomonas euvesicatoria]MBB4869255.1 hypothetical protein [Xanthomonas euvesicatoria]
MFGIDALGVVYFALPGTSLCPLISLHVSFGSCAARLPILKVSRSNVLSPEARREFRKNSTDVHHEYLDGSRNGDHQGYRQEHEDDQGNVGGIRRTQTALIVRPEGEPATLEVRWGRPPDGA